MQFTPKTSEDIARMRLKPEGAYAFDVANAEDGISKSSGKEMIVLDLNLYDANGNIFQLRDWLVPGTNYGDKKIFEACKSCGLGSKYALGQVNAEDFLGKSGWAKVKIGKAQPKDKSNPNGDKYDPKNEIAWYLDEEQKQSAPAPALKNQPSEEKQFNVNQEASEDVPF